MEEFDLVVSGKLVLENHVTTGEIGIANGKIARISDREGTLTGKARKQFGDAYVFPGFIDTHVHCFSNPEEGFVRASESAAAGGVTTFLDMPYDLPNPITDEGRFRGKVEQLEREALVDIGLWGTISKHDGIGQIVPLALAGAAAFKMSTFETDAYRFPRIPDNEIYKAMEEVRKTGLRIAFHSENNEIIVDMIDRYRRDNKVYPRAHMETRPPVTESSEVLKLMEFAYWTGAKIHIVHVSHPNTIELINFYKQRGVQVTCETCYPYLLLDVNDLDRLGPKAKMNPPLRFPSDVAGMWEHLQAGHIDLISSDHAPWTKEQKEAGKGDIFKSPSGLSGLELLGPLLFDEAVARGRLSPIVFARAMSQHPAETYGIAGKGKLAEGYDADLVVIDANASFTVDENKLRSISKITPFHGRTVRGKILRTIVRGTTVYDGNDIVVEPGFGNFVPGSAFQRVQETVIRS
ncbi:dihydroorotase family protein [Paenibacillaceae bacterium WGS1546]|uniref:dihydroorotase n=1 Tax=Cohnella sp. WGS1546 TaxID=3366810 RepID=UPI00372D8652